jgi:hypothetical protein
MRQDVDGDAQRLSQLCWMFFLKIIDDQDQQLEVMQDNYRSPIPEALQWRTWADDHGNPAELLAKLEQDEQNTTSLRDQLKAILAEALLR